MTTIEEIRRAFVDEAGWPQAVPVQGQKIELWMQYPSLENRGVLFHFIVEERDKYKIEPDFSGEILFPFTTRYFEDCLSASERLAQNSRWILSGTDLSHGIARWAFDYWKRHGATRRERERLKAWLQATLTKFSRQRELLAIAISDHLFFTSVKIRKQFSSWSNDPQLASLFPELSEISD